MPVSKFAPLCGLALALAAFTPSEAAPLTPAPAGQVSAQAASNVVDVRYRRWHHHRGGWGRGLALGLGAAIVGGIVANEIYRPRPGYYYDDEVYDGPYYAPAGYNGDPRVLCARNFRSFEWNTGLYTTYGGDKRLCPYLR